MTSRWFGLVIIACMSLFALWAFPSIQTPVPIHSNEMAQVDLWASPFESVILPPVLGLIFYSFMLANRPISWLITPLSSSYEFPTKKLLVIPIVKIKSQESESMEKVPRGRSLSHNLKWSLSISLTPIRLSSSAPRLFGEWSNSKQAIKIP